MSGVYIRGMEVPTKCIECRLMRRCGKYDLDFVCMPARIYVEDLTNAYRPRPTWCPLVPVPDHGRLIDADALDADLEKQDMKTGEWDAIGFSISEIDNAPTIIPASEGLNNEQ